MKRALLILMFVSLAAVGAEKRKQPRLADPTPEEEHYPRFSFDLGAASGVSNGVTFFEIYGGLNTYFNSWFLWRNAPFFRFQ